MFDWTGQAYLMLGKLVVAQPGRARHPRSNKQTIEQVSERAIKQLTLFIKFIGSWWINQWVLYGCEAVVCIVSGVSILVAGN